MLTWLRNKLAKRSVEDIVNLCLGQYNIQYDPVIGARFYNTDCCELGFAIYQRFSDQDEMDQELAEDIVVFMKTFYSFLEKNRNKIRHTDFLKFAYMTFQSWRYIVNDCVENGELIDEDDDGENEEEHEFDHENKYDENDEDDEERVQYKEQEKYLKIKWQNAQDLELAERVKKTITPLTKLKLIEFELPELIFIENHLKNYGFRTQMTSKDIEKCENKDIGYMIKKYFSHIEKP